MVSDDEMKNVKEVFDAYDLDSTGKITFSELRDLLLEQKWCMDWNRMQMFVVEHIGNASMINFDQFKQLYVAMLETQPVSIRKANSKNANINVVDLRELEADARHNFASFDKDGSGCLDVEEMKQVMADNGVPDIDGDFYERCVNDRMKTIDVNSDGQVDFEEFTLYGNAVFDNFYKHGIVEGGDPGIVAAE